MNTFARRRVLTPLLIVSISICIVATAAHLKAQQPLKTPSIVHKVKQSNEQMQMTVNTSRILTLDQKIPQAQVNNPGILDLTPLSPTEIQISAKAPGVTQINLWGEDKKVFTIDVIVFGDARELDMILRSQFPNCSLNIVPLASGVLISGYVDKPEYVDLIVRIAEEYYPKVINNMYISGVQQVLLHVKVMEGSRTKLRRLGFDWAQISKENIVLSGVSGLINSVSPAKMVYDINAGTITDEPITAVASGSPTFSFNIVDDSNAFFGVLEALRQDNLMKILAEPTLVTVSGRPASFNVGGEIPILVPESLGTISIEYKKFGTQVDFVPIVLGNGRIRLEVRPRVSEIDPSVSIVLQGIVVPGLRTREVDTGVEMQAGQTLAIAGLVQTRTEAINRGLPWVSDVPYLGALFRKVEEQTNEVELLMLVTPELVEAMDPHEVPPCGPGMRTTSPSDCELYLKGHLEVPNCCPSCNGAPCQQCVPAETSQAGWLGRRSTPPQATSRHNQQTPPEPQNATLGSKPKFIGPIGYDVVK